jgi:hypothetical protein
MLKLPNCTSSVTSSSSQTPPKSNVTDLAGIGPSHGPSTRRAVLLVFPHRKELSVYGAHIEDSFLANPSTPYRVLKVRQTSLHPRH